MIYIVPLFICFYLFVRYDLSSNKRGEKLWYYLLLFIFIAISGFAYNIGADTPGYMYEYDSYKWSNLRKVQELTEVYHRQAGWVLLNLICKQISSSYVFFQLVSAIFFNVVIFSFIRKNCKYVFLGIFFYAAVLYLQLNFNAIRQAYAICFFLIGYESLKDNKIVKYYCWALIAFSFHVSAVILLFIPLLGIVKINRKTLMILGFLLLILVYASLNFHLDTFFLSLFSDMLEEEGTLLNIGELGNKFMGERYVRTVSINIFGIIELVFNLSIMIFVAMYNYTHNKVANKYWIIFLLLYCACYVLNVVIPVVFYRFREYFEIVYYCAFTFCIVDLGNKYLKRNKIAIAFICLFFAIQPIISLFAINPSSGIPLIRQFYPYYSVFDKEIDPVRASHFGSHR